MYIILFPSLRALNTGNNQMDGGEMSLPDMEIEDHRESRGNGAI